MNYYDILGVSQNSSAVEIADAYLEKAERVRPERFIGAPSEVIAAVKQASVAIEAAWHVLGDGTSRAEYNAELGAETPERGLSHLRRFEWRKHHAEHVWAIEQNLGLPLTPVLGISPPSKPASGEATSGKGLAATAGPEYSLGDPLARFANWLAPHGKAGREVSVPNVCGEHASDALYAVAKADLDIKFVRLTEHPRGNGIVVDQDPPAGTTVRRGSTVTVRAVYETDPTAPT